MASICLPRVPSNNSSVRKRRELASNVSQPGSGEPVCPDLLSFDKMPEWFQHDNNRLIMRGYRPIPDSVHSSLRSWCYAHNETVNIYSHLIPAIVFFVGEWHLLRHLTGKYNKLTTTDTAAFSFFMLAATICYASSALYHTLMNHSHIVDRFCHRLDMLGIGIFIVSDIALEVHILFWCESTMRNVYWSMVSRSPYTCVPKSVVGADRVFIGRQIGIFGLTTIVTNAHPKLQSYEYRLTRTLAFVATGSFAVLPLIHGLGIFGLELMNKKAFTYTLIAKIGCLLPGTALYVVSHHPVDIRKRLYNNTQDSKDEVS